MGYKYFDTPDGEDCYLKMWYLSKNAAFLGVVTGTTDVILYSHSKGYMQTAGRFIFHIAPLTAMAATFAATTCVARSIRDKDDGINHVIGAFSAGTIFGIWTKSTRAGIYGSLALAVAAYLKKTSVQEGWELFPQPKTFDKYIFDPVKHDFSTLKGK